jgi:hypothetical protein
MLAELVFLAAFVRKLFYLFSSLFPELWTSRRLRGVGLYLSPGLDWRILRH